MGARSGGQQGGAPVRQPVFVRPHPPFPPNTFRPAVENSDPPRLVVLADVAWPASERPVALASSAGGDLALLFLTSGALAHVRVLSPGRALGSARTLAGVSTPFSLAYVSATEVAVLMPQVAEAAVLSLDDPADEIPQSGDYYPLKNHDGGPFLHTTVPTAHYPGTDGPRGLSRLSLPAYARLGTVSDHSDCVLDSGNRATTWHRLYVEAAIPEHCGFTVKLAAVNDRQAVPADDEWFPHQFGAAASSDSATPRGAWLRVSSEIPYHPGVLPCPRERTAPDCSRRSSSAAAHGRRVRIAARPLSQGQDRAAG